MGNYSGGGNFNMTGKRRYTLIMLLCMVTVLGSMIIAPEEAHAKSMKLAKVTSVRVTSTDYNAVYLKWGAQSGVKKYQVYRSTSRTGKYKLIRTNSKNTYKDAHVQTGITYWYKVRAVKGLRRGAFSAPVNGVPRLKKPDFHAASRPEGAKLTAGKVNGAQGYIFYRGGKVIKTQSGRVYTDKGAPAMDPAIYKVVAYRNVKGKRQISPVSKQLPASKITVKVKLVGTKLPGTIKSTSDFKKTGYISSNYPFNGVEIGIIRDNKWVRKYQRKGLNTMGLNLSNADSSFSFKNLPSGSYKFRIYVHFEDGVVHTVLNHPFTVNRTYGNPNLKGAAGAVAWAKDIANDDSFAYGTGRRAHKRGCYFCGTNSKFKPAGYEKTYCCNPFVLAAYAHGAKDPTMLKKCQEGACGGMLPREWDYGCFKTVGPTKKVAYTSLKPGDFIISDPSAGGPYNHVWMFCGNNQYVDAGKEGWGKDTIAVRSNAKGYYQIYQRGGCYVMRYTK